MSHLALATNQNDKHGNKATWNAGSVWGWVVWVGFEVTLMWLDSTKVPS